MFIIADILIWTTVALLVIAVCVAVVSKLMSMRKNKTARIVNGIRAKLVTWIATGGTIALLVITFFALPADTLRINGNPYSESVWLRMTNMCVVTSVILLIVAIIALIIGIPRRKK